MIPPGTVVVVPNHLPHLDFLAEWRDELLETEIIVVQDGDEQPEYHGSLMVTVYTWADIERDLGENAWIIPRRTSAVRSYGIWKAWQTGAEIIATLDNDCYPTRREWVNGHVWNLGQKVTLDWWPSVPPYTPSEDETPFTRGFPYGIRSGSDVWLSHGLWEGAPDLDAATALARPGLGVPLPSKHDVWAIPRWSFFPMCGMNLAFDARLTPAMWFGLFGPDYGFDQYDDIWCGVLAKKVLDVLGKAAVSGAPLVEHRRQSSPFANLRKQAPGLEANEFFWQAVSAVNVGERLAAVFQYGIESLVRADGRSDVAGIYSEIIRALPDRIQGDESLPDGYFKRFKQGALIWASLFEEG